MTIRSAPGVIVREVGDEFVILDLERGVYYGLQDVAARVWQSLAAGHSIPETVETLLSEYEVEREQLEGDLARLVEELREAGLVLVD
ncbi:MAG TPA: PqqD family protein [Thermoanaerobaculia bacterium]|nr:PqqD family protein [Thermoanaerobaculia bacterium]